MIPKQLFFIWLGDNMPNYVDFAIKTFKDVNPDFKVDLINFTDNEVLDYRNPESKIFKMIKTDFFSKIKDRYDEYLKRYKSELSLLKVKLSVPIRYSIISKYGGIYVDCDTFPIKPFDDVLLEKEWFCCTQENDKPDCFFIGGSTKYKKPYHLKTQSWYKRNFEPYYFDLCRKFYNCTLKYGEHYNDPKEHYIDHYWHREFKYK